MDAIYLVRVSKAQAIGTASNDLYIGGMAFFQTRHLRINEVSADVAVLVLDRDASPTNILDLPMLDDLERALDAVINAKRHRLLAILSGKPDDFCHGPTPALLAKWKKADFASWAERGQRLCAKLADMPIPSLCVIHGNCLDAALEMALACDRRIVVDDAALGFPQLEWGMIPCWGATQRLPRLIGLDNSLQMLLAGRQIDGRTAWEWNLVDEFADDEDNPPLFVQQPNKRGTLNFPDRTWRQRLLESNRLGRWFIFRGAERILRTRLPEEMPAPARMLDGLRLAYAEPIGTGLDFECQAMNAIAEHPALHHLLRLLQQRERLRPPTKREGRPGVCVGVIGSGLAALSLLLHSITRGYDVVLRAENEMALATALAQIVQLLQVEVQSGGMEIEHYHKILASIRGTYTWTHFDKLDLVIDTTDGTLADKQAFYTDIEKHIRPTALIVATTLLHRCAELRQNLKSPLRLVGLRLVEPWNRGAFAELVGDGANAQRVREWAVGIGKFVLATPDNLGGVIMRIWLPLLNEAGLLIKEGVRIDQIDQAIRRFGMTYGPCEWMDRLGVDHVAALAQTLQPMFASRINFESGFGLMVDKGWLGNTTGGAFYRAGLLGRKPAREVVSLWQQSQGESMKPVPALAECDMHAWIQRRLVTLTMLEAIRCLEEGLLKEADDLDCAICLTGWAMHRGGPLGHARELGPQTLTARCQELAQQFGPRFAPLASRFFAN